MIADVVSYAIAGIGFIYAAGRLFVRKGFIPSMNTVMTLNVVILVKTSMPQRRASCLRQDLDQHCVAKDALYDISMPLFEAPDVQARLVAAAEGMREASK